MTKEERAQCGHEALDRKMEDLVARIQANESAAQEELYGLFQRGMRYRLVQQLGADDVEDRIHDVFMAVLDQIRRGAVKEPARLMGFISVVVNRHICAVIRQRQADRGLLEADQDAEDYSSGVRDTQPNPEQMAIQNQRVAIMREMLAGLAGSDREILTRFYIQGQKREQICREMRLTDTQFRLRKSRLKQAFVEEVRARLVPHATKIRFTGLD